MDDDGATAEAPQKRSLFAKSLMSKQSLAESQEDATDFFRQPRQTLSSIIHEREQKKKEKIAKKLKAKARKDEVHKDDDDVDEPSKSRKKRKISDDGDEEDDLEGEYKSSRTPGTHSRPTRGQTASPSQVRQSPRNKDEREDSATGQTRPSKADVVNLGDSGPEAGDDDDDLYAPPPQAKQSPINVKSRHAEVVELDGGNEDPVDQDYLDLLARARERARQKEIDALKHSLAQAESKGMNAADAPVPPPAVPDPPVSIFVSSTIEGTKPIIIRIYLSKKISEVLKHWCSYNQLSEQQSADVFLAWRRFKQWPTTTLKRMLEGVVDFEVRDDGTIISKPGGKGDGLSDDFSRIHLVATTKDGLAELKKVHQRTINPPSPEHSDNEDADFPLSSHTSGDAPAPTTENNIRLLLKAQKEYGEFKIKVRKDTPVVRIIAAFRSTKKIPDEKVMSLVFDGERLDPDAKVGDTEIEDMDTVEVHVR